MQFSATITRNDQNGSLVNEVFDREVKLCTEAVAEATVPAGHIALIGEHRGFTLANNRGRKARNAGETVVDLSAVSLIALDDVPNLIKQLSVLVDNAPTALPMLEQMADEARAARDAAAAAAVESEG